MNDKRTIINGWFKSGETPADIELSGPEIGVDQSVKAEVYGPADATLEAAEELLDAAA